MRQIVALLLLGLVSACTSGGLDPIVGEAVSDLGELFPGREEQAVDAAEAQRLRRADIIAADVAAVWARLENDPAPTLMYAASDNGGYVTYASQFRQLVTLRGTRVTATRGLGTDLLWTTARGPDPLMLTTPPARWPARVERSYAFPADNPVGAIESFVCTIQPGVPAEQVILERRYLGVEIQEVCIGPTGRFENHYFADRATGFVWRSLQWIGWKMQPLDLQILEPYTPG